MDTQKRLVSAFLQYLMGSLGQYLHKEMSHHKKYCRQSKAMIFCPSIGQKWLSLTTSVILPETIWDTSWHVSLPSCIISGKMALAAECQGLAKMASRSYSYNNVPLSSLWCSSTSEILAGVDLSTILEGQGTQDRGSSFSSLKASGHGGEAIGHRTKTFDFVWVVLKNHKIRLNAGNLIYIHQNFQKHLNACKNSLSSCKTIHCCAMSN